jgi:Ni/Fe-hydrogenase subunit HybB-like protein
VQRGATRLALSLGDLVGAVSGLGLLVSSFLPWYSAGGENATAWQSFAVIDLVMAAAAVAGLSVVIVVLIGLSVSYPVAGSAVTTLFGGLALILIAYRLINPPGVADVGREIGAWLGLVAAAGVSLGGYLGMQEP